MNVSILITFQNIHIKCNIAPHADVRINYFFQLFYFVHFVFFVDYIFKKFSTIFMPYSVTIDSG